MWKYTIVLSTRLAKLDSLRKRMMDILSVNLKGWRFGKRNPRKRSSSLAVPFHKYPWLDVGTTQLNRAMFPSHESPSSVLTENGLQVRHLKRKWKLVPISRLWLLPRFFTLYGPQRGFSGTILASWSLFSVFFTITEGCTFTHTYIQCVSLKPPYHRFELRKIKQTGFPFFKVVDRHSSVEGHLNIGSVPYKTIDCDEYVFTLKNRRTIRKYITNELGKCNQFDCTSIHLSLFITLYFIELKTKPFPIIGLKCGLSTNLVLGRCVALRWALLYFSITQWGQWLK